MDTVVVVEPAEEPVSLAEAKRHARIDPDLADDDLDGLLTRLIRAARRTLERRLGRAFVTQTLETTWRDPPLVTGGGEAVIRLPRAPVSDVIEVRRFSGGATETVDPSRYCFFTGTPGIVRVLDTSMSDVLTVRYSAGYGAAADVPDDAKLAIEILTAHWYDRREPIVAGTIVNTLPFSVESLIDPLRWGNHPT